ncbi:unnamed protein product, partial [Citrullus colocynthis]
NLAFSSPSSTQPSFWYNKKERSQAFKLQVGCSEQTVGHLGQHFGRWDTVVGRCHDTWTLLLDAWTALWKPDRTLLDTQ